jgi:hypothetical protein
MAQQLLSRQQLVQNAIAHVGYYDLHPDVSINFQYLVSSGSEMISLIMDLIKMKKLNQIQSFQI